MARVKIVLNDSGIREFLNSSHVQAMLLSRARGVAGRAGSGYIADVQAGKRRAHARVETQTGQAYRDNLADNTLLKALGGS